MFTVMLFDPTDQAVGGWVAENRPQAMALEDHLFASYPEAEGWWTSVNPIEGTED